MEPIAAHQGRSSGSGGRRGPSEVTAAEKTQAREVSLRRIGWLFRGYRWPLTVVTAIIVASSVVAMASPFLLRAVIDQALPQQNLTLLIWLVVGMLAVAGITAALGVIQTWISTNIGQQVMHALRTDVFAHLQRQSNRVLHPCPHRGRAVPHHQRHRRDAVRGHLDRNLGGLHPHHGRRHRGGEGRAGAPGMGDCLGVKVPWRKRWC